MPGSWSSEKWASNVEPITWVTLPILPFSMGYPISLKVLRISLGQRVCAADDIQELHGDLRLAGAVVLPRQRLDHVARGVRRRFHGDHAGHLLGDRRVVEGLEEPHPHRRRQQLVGELPWIGWELV